MDGTITSSKIITLVQDEIYGMKVLSAYPNPAKNNFNLDLAVSQNETVKLEILSTRGKVIITISKNLKQGLNMLELDVRNFEAGMYLIRIINVDSGEFEIVRFVVE